MTSLSPAQLGPPGRRVSSGPLVGRATVTEITYCRGVSVVELPLRVSVDVTNRGSTPIGIIDGSTEVVAIRLRYSMPDGSFRDEMILEGPDAYEEERALSKSDVVSLQPGASTTLSSLVALYVNSSKHSSGPYDGSVIALTLKVTINWTSESRLSRARELVPGLSIASIPFWTEPLEEFTISVPQQLKPCGSEDVAAPGGM